MTERVQSTSGAGKRIPVSNVEIYVDDQGSGEPVILLHGGIMDHQSWGNQIPALAEHFRVISPDTRGHGRSTDADDEFTYELFAADMVALMDELGIARASIVGFSDGGDAGLVLAREHADRVDKLVLLGTPYHTSNYPPGTAEHFSTLTTPELYDMVGDDSEFGEVVHKAQALYEPDAWEAFWQKLVNRMWSTYPDYELGYLAGVTAPTLVCHGENEPFFDVSISQAMVDTMPRAELRIIPGATHTMGQEKPEDVNAAIIEFLQR
jgi:pimeloyl-ACP methyl ester carboxylesterase